MVEVARSVRDFIAEGPLAHIVTIGEDGMPHVTLAWVGFDGDELVWSTFYHLEQVKLRNLRRDPRIAISFQVKEHSGEGLHPYLVIEGRARITEGGALEIMDRLSPAYIGMDRFPNRDAPAGVVVHVVIDRIYGVGPWKDDAVG
jgi:PPOX class probable F420-dependent enzyme